MGIYLLNQSRAVDRREAAYALAAYYGWASRHGAMPPGNNPLTGRPWMPHDPVARHLGAAAYRTLAREMYKVARALPGPRLP